MEVELISIQISLSLLKWTNHQWLYFAFIKYVSNSVRILIQRDYANQNQDSQCCTVSWFKNADITNAVLTHLPVYICLTLNTENFDL